MFAFVVHILLFNILFKPKCLIRFTAVKVEVVRKLNPYPAWSLCLSIYLSIQLLKTDSCSQHGLRFWLSRSSFLQTPLDRYVVVGLGGEGGWGRSSAVAGPSLGPERCCRKMMVLPSSRISGFAAAAMETSLPHAFDTSGLSFHRQESQAAFFVLFWFSVSFYKTLRFVQFRFVTVARNRTRLKQQ